MLCLLPGGWTALCYNTGDKQQVTPLTRAHLSPAQWLKFHLTALHSKSPTATVYHQTPFYPEIIHKWAGYLSFPVLLLGFLRKD